MRTIIPITCALCIATSSRADTPPPEAPASPAPEKAPEQPAAASPAPATAPVPAPTPAPATAPARPPAAAPLPELPVAPPPKHSRIPEITASIVTGGLLITTGYSYWKWNDAQAVRRAAQWDPDISLEEYEAAVEDIKRWKKRTWILIGGTFVSSAVTAFLWMRNQDPSSFSVQPTGDDGAAVWYSGRF